MKKPVHQIIRDKREWEGPGRPSLPRRFAGGTLAGFLPHCDKPGLIQFLTFRLEDALPIARQDQWKAFLEIRDKRQRVVQFERYIDLGYGACHLRQPAIARLVEEAFLHFDGQRHRLIAWVIMPNHAYVVAEITTASLSKIIQSWKSFTASRANQIVGASGPFWQEDYLDRFTRDEDQFCRAVRYVESNPVKAGLCQAPEEWLFSSAHPRWQWTSRDLHQRYLGAQLVSERWQKTDLKPDLSSHDLKATTSE